MRTKISDSQYIITIGTSAAGLKALTSFFDHKLFNSASFIMIQQLSPGFKSKMVKLLARRHSKRKTMQSNKEFLSAHEKMQRAYEELKTSNSQQQVTIKELTEHIDDLDNYFRSNLNPQLVVDHQLILRKYSPGAVQQINIKNSDIGCPVNKLSATINLKILIADIQKVMDTAEVLLREVESTEGKIYRVMTAPYIRQKTNKADGAIITFYDITDLKRTQAELDKSNKIVLRINADLDNFVYSASHDLAAPICNIQSVMSILQRKMDTSDPDVQKFITIFNNSIANFKEIIKELSVIGTIEADMRKESYPESFSELFNDIQVSIATQITQANAVFSTDFRVKEIKFPKKNLRSIMVNLISNAIKFRLPGRNPEIIIRTERTPDYILLTVKDNGTGIESDRLDYIFKMYQRLNKDIEGQGIGLYLIKKIINASGGKVEAESEPGLGTTFKIFFKA